MHPFQTIGDTVYVTNSTNLPLNAGGKPVMLCANVQMTGPIFDAQSITCEAGATYQSHEHVPTTQYA